MATPLSQWLGDRPTVPPAELLRAAQDLLAAAAREVDFEQVRQYQEVLAAVSAGKPLNHRELMAELDELLNLRDALEAQAKQRKQASVRLSEVVEQGLKDVQDLALWHEKQATSSGNDWHAEQARLLQSVVWPSEEQVVASFGALLPKVQLELPDGDPRTARPVFTQWKAGVLQVCVALDEPESPAPSAAPGQKKPVYVLLHEDRHTDTTAQVFLDKERAISYARELVRSFEPEHLDETLTSGMAGAGWLYYGCYSCEGCHVRVVQVGLSA